MIGYSTVLVAVLIGIVPVFGFVWWFVSGGREKMGLNLFMKTFFWGVLTAVPASIFQIINANSSEGSVLIVLLQELFGGVNSYFVTHSLIPFLFVAIVEEGSKGLGIILSLRSFSHSPRVSKWRINPGTVAGVIVGLAFGVTENGVYFANNFATQGGSELIVSIIIMRFLLSTSAHMIYSGLLGMFLVDFLVAKNFKGKIIALLGISLPVIIHTTFNILVTTAGLGVLTIPLLLFGLFVLIFRTVWPLFNGNKL